MGDGELFEAGDAGLAGEESSSVPDTGSEVLGETSTSEVATAETPVDTSKLSEDELFKWAETQTKPVVQAPALADDAGKPPAEATPAPLAPQSPGQQVLDAESGFKAALKGLATTNPAAAKQIRDEHYTLAAYKELYPIHEARALRGMFGSVDEAKEAQGAAARLMEVDHAIVNDPATLIHDIASNNPQVMEGIASTFGRALFDVSPDLYRKNLAEPAVQTYLEFYENRALQTGNEELKLAIGILRDVDNKYWAGQSGQTTQFDKAMQSRLDQLEQAEKQRDEQSRVAFRGSIDTAYQTALSKDVLAAIDRSGAALSDKGKQEVIGRVLGQIGQVMQDDPVLQRKLGLEIVSGQRDDAHNQRITNYLLSRAKGLVGPSTRDVIKELTEGILAAQGIKTSAVSYVPPRPRGPVGAPPGTSRGTPAGPLTRAELMKLTPEQIVERYTEGE